MIWRALAEAAGRVYCDPNRTRVGAIEYATYTIESAPVFAIAGTNGWRDWICNLHRARQPFSLRGRRCMAHAGFLRAARAIYTDFGHWQRQVQGPVSIVGHSQGAALSAIIAMIAEAEAQGSIKRLCCVAMPRVGDQALADAFGELFPDPDRYRLYGRRRDPVCHLPYFGYSRLAPYAWLPSQWDGRLDHGVCQYIKLITE